MSFDYQVTAQPQSDLVDEATPGASTFLVNNHDDLLQIVQRLESISPADTNKD